MTNPYPHELLLTKEQDEYLKKLYYTDKNFFGRDRLFKLVEKQLSEKALVPRIYKAQVSNWLKQQQVHQRTTKPPKQTKSRPIRASKSAILQIDLIDMSGNPSRGNNFILNVIDIFSKYVWSFPLKKKEAKLVKTKLEDI